MEPLVANPATMQPALYSNSLRLGAFAFIGVLPDEARSPIRIDFAIIERPAQILSPASSNLKAKPATQPKTRIRQQSLCVIGLTAMANAFLCLLPDTNNVPASLRAQLPDHS